MTGKEINLKRGARFLTEFLFFSGRVPTGLMFVGFLNFATHMEKTYYKAIFAAGCFWHVQEVFDKVPGVLATTVGYVGGEGLPSYENIENKGYAEAIKITFDPRVISYPELLDIFWKIHDPTTLDRQGADVGRRYRSGIFYRSDKQKEQAASSMRLTQEKFLRPIVTEILPEKNFYPAEEYHQKYFEKNTRHFCAL